MTLYKNLLFYLKGNLSIYMDEALYLKLDKIIDKEALEEYIKLEIRIRDFIDYHTSNICNICDKKCCIFKYCIETLRSPWNIFILKSKNILDENLFEKKVKSREPFGLSENGWIYPIGRYKYCTSFICRRLKENFNNELNVFAYKCISNILLFVNSNFVNKMALDEISDLNLFTKERFERLKERIILGNKLFEYSKFVFYNEEKYEKVIDTAEQILFIKKYLPFIS